MNSMLAGSLERFYDPQEGNYNCYAYAMDGTPYNTGTNVYATDGRPYAMETPDSSCTVRFLGSRGTVMLWFSFLSQHSVHLQQSMIPSF